MEQLYNENVVYWAFKYLAGAIWIQDCHNKLWKKNYYYVWAYTDKCMFKILEMYQHEVIGLEELVGRFKSKSTDNLQSSDIFVAWNILKLLEEWGRSWDFNLGKLEYTTSW